MNEDVTQPPYDTAIGDRSLHLVGKVVGSPPGSGDLEAVLVEHFQNLSGCRPSALACILRYPLARAARGKPVLGAANA